MVAVWPGQANPLKARRTPGSIARTSKASIPLIRFDFGLRVLVLKRMEYSAWNKFLTSVHFETVFSSDGCDLETGNVVGNETANGCLQFSCGFLSFCSVVPFTLRS